LGKSELGDYLRSVYDVCNFDATQTPKDIWYAYSKRRKRGKHIAVIDAEYDSVYDFNYTVLE
jgi:hypothetical protein